MVSSEPGQDLEGEAQRLLFASGGSGNTNEEEEPEDRMVKEIVLCLVYYFLVLRRCLRVISVAEQWPASPSIV